MLKILACGIATSVMLIPLLSSSVIAESELSIIVGGRDYYCIDDVVDPAGDNCYDCRLYLQNWGKCSSINSDLTWEQLPAGEPLNWAQDSERNCGGWFYEFYNSSCTGVNNYVAPCTRKYTGFTFTPISGPPCSD